MAVYRGPFVGDEKRQTIHDALNGAGVESMQAKWEEMFGGEERSEKKEVKVKKPRKKAVVKKAARKKTASQKITSEKAESSKPEIKKRKPSAKK